MEDILSKNIEIHSFKQLCTFLAKDERLAGLIPLTLIVGYFCAKQSFID